MSDNSNPQAPAEVDPLAMRSGETADSYFRRLANTHVGPPPDVSEVLDAVADLRDEVRGLAAKRLSPLIRPLDDEPEPGAVGPGLDGDVPPPDPEMLVRSLENDSSAQAFDPPLLKDFAEQHPPKVFWTADGYAARGNVTVVAGHPKSGKTTLLAELVGAVSANGAKFLGRNTAPGGVLWIDLEQPRGLTTRVLTEHCSADAPVYVQHGTLPSLTAAAAWCREHDIVLVIVDSLSKVWKVFGVEDENDATAVEAAMAPLLTFGREADVALVLVHHLRKSGGAEGLDVRGSGHIAAVVDVLISFRRFSTDGGASDTRRVLEAFSRYDETPAKLVIERVAGRYTVAGTPEQIRRRGERDKVAAALTGIPQTAAELADITSLTGQAVRTVLKQLADEPEHVVERTGTGKKGNPFRYARRKMLVRTTIPVAAHKHSGESEPAISEGQA